MAFFLRMLEVVRHQLKLASLASQRDHFSSDDRNSHQADSNQDLSEKRQGSEVGEESGHGKMYFGYTGCVTAKGILKKTRWGEGRFLGMPIE
ncbi:MAG: hypothetical protein IPJ40_08300 [Saprospirales bacterium]|nr:hypothetical protein [Saprospirales bacterium]